MGPLSGDHCNARAVATIVQTVTEVTPANVVVLNEYDAVIDFLLGSPIIDVARHLQLMS